MTLPRPDLPPPHKHPTGRLCARNMVGTSGTGTSTSGTNTNAINASAASVTGRGRHQPQTLPQLVADIPLVLWAGPDQRGRARQTLGWPPGNRQPRASLAPPDRYQGRRPR
jgi:hypothetical protein